MQIYRQTQLSEGPRPGQATSADARFHHKPVHRAISTEAVGRDHNAFPYPEKSLDQFSVCSGVKGNNNTSIVITDGVLLGVAANQRVTANNFPHNFTNLPSNQRHQSYCNRRPSVLHSQTPYRSSTADSMQRYAGARPKNKYPATPNSNSVPDHLTRNIHLNLSVTGIDPWFTVRHSQDDYYQNPEKVAADLNNRIVDMKSCMTEPSTGYDASPLPPYRSVNGGLPAYNNPPPPAGSDYCGLPLADSWTQQSGNPEYSTSAQQQRAAAIPNRTTGVAGVFLPPHSGSGYSSCSRSEKSQEVTTNIDITRPAMSGQPVDEPASGQSQESPDVHLTPHCYQTTDESNSDQSLLELEQQVEEACARINVLLRQQEDERAAHAVRVKKHEDKLRANRRRKKQEREKIELDYAKLWPARQDAITCESNVGCQHCKRKCWVKFECCNVYYSCHRCHNASEECSNDKVKARDATHFKCRLCHHEDTIDENSQRCSRCKATMSAYFCAICKHFTGTAKNPYHCEKCGICRIHKDKSFHCEICNVCMDEKLKGKHKCRPDSGHDSCGICLEDVFSGCQLLPCSHRLHPDCLKAMIKNGVRTCPVCRHNINSPAPD